MRLSTAEDPDRARATLAAALDAGITVFDTARAYTPTPSELGANERFLAHALADAGGARIVTKGGMTRPAGAWVPDGRAKAIAADCEASLVALGGLPVDLYLLHAPDPRVPFATSLRALARLVEHGLVRRVGVCNVNRAQLEQACALAPISAVQVALSAADDTAVRGGVVAYCAEHVNAVIAHSPLGGPKRAARLADREAGQLALARVLATAPTVIAIPGATRPETARAAADAARLDAAQHAAPRPASSRPPSVVDGEVAMIMGIAGAGKSRLAAAYVARGYARLNRDERGGSLKAIAEELDALLGRGGRRIVLDNSYLSRAERARVIAVAQAHGLRATCTWIEAPLDQAQINLVTRLLDHFGELPAPQRLTAEAKRVPGLMLPTSQMRMLRELEPPAADEGFASVEAVAFVRAAAAGGGAGAIVAAAAVMADAAAVANALGAPGPILIQDWRPGGDAAELDAARLRLSAHTTSEIHTALCPHPGGPPRCWCRPPLPGLALAFMRAQGLQASRTTVVGGSPAYRSLARALGAYFTPVPGVR